ncbi:chemotaxis protein CheA [Deltaproteobacteria bacterium TL4]
MMLSINPQHVPVFSQSLSEAALLLNDLENHILMLESQQDWETLFKVFQPLCQIRGSGQFLNLLSLESVSQLMLEILTAIQKQTLIVHAETIDLLLETVQTLKTILVDFYTSLRESIPASDGMISLQEPELPSGLLTQLKQLNQAKPPQTPSYLYPVLDAKINWPPGMKEMFLDGENESLLAIEDLLLKLESAIEPSPLLQQLFRLLHSMKGNTGVLRASIPDEAIRSRHPLSSFHDLTHKFESVIALYRDPQKNLDQQGIDTLLKVVDLLKELLKFIKQDETYLLDLHPFFLSLQRLSGVSPEITVFKTTTGKKFTPETMAFLNTADQCLEMLENAIEEAQDPVQKPLALKKYRRGVKMLHKAAQKFDNSTILQVSQTLLDGLVSWESEEPSTKNMPQSEAQEFLAQLKRELEKIHSSIEVSLPVENEEAVSQTTQASKIPDSSFVRVHQTQIDRIMNLIGELMIRKNVFPALVQELNQTCQFPKIAQKVKKTGSDVGRITDELQVRIMEIRMAPVQSVFSRFSRMIRDLSISMKKSIELKMEGETTLLDKSILEQIVDPLTHLLRNSCDHGIESSEERTRVGKSEVGILELKAERKGQFVVLSVRDDGRGMHREQIAAKGISMGLIHSQDLERMDDSAVFAMILHPGFSTASQVSEVSGRGVGMDVVRSTIEKIGGKIDIESEFGKGTLISLTIPLTLAVTRGLMIESAETCFIIPLNHVREMLKVPASKIRQFTSRQQMLEIRDSIFPVINESVYLS